MSKKQARREKARLREIQKQGLAKKPEAEQDKQQRQPDNKGKGLLNFFKWIYEKEYKKLMIITFIILILAFVQIGYQTATTGDFIKKGVTLKGGITITIPDTTQNAIELQEYLKSSFPSNDITVRTLTGVGGSTSLTVEADVTDQDEINRLESDIGKKLSIT
ncbi:MAG: hypothetical protein KKE20_05260, partial [Nanoarchaeota archaeon]|nr:hypothetical protein [Nanoarchaeota archaeon]